MSYASFNSKSCSVLLYAMIATGLQEKDYCFFISDFYKNQIECFLNEETKLRVKDFVLQFENEHRETIK